MSIRELFLLCFCNFLWAVNPTMSKLLVSQVGAPATAWLRYTSAFAVLVIYLGIKRNLDWLFRPKRLRDLLPVIGIAATTCFLSPMTQMRGLAISSAVSSALLVTFEPLFTVFLAWIVFREKLRHVDGLGFLLSISGFALLSGMIHREFWEHWGSGRTFDTFLGDLLLVIAVMGEACYSVFARLLIGRYAGTAIYGSALGLGALMLTGAHWALQGRLVPDLQPIRGWGWAALLWIGPVGTTWSYLLWMRLLQRGIPLAAMVMTLFLQPVFGAIIGILFGGESLSIDQGLGGALILGAVFVMQRPTEE